jgi:hypothetical protein
VDGNVSAIVAGTVHQDDVALGTTTESRNKAVVTTVNDKVTSGTFGN